MLDAISSNLYLARPDKVVSSMKNGLYSVHIFMLDGVRGRDSGVMILRDGVLMGGGPYFWSIGGYTVGEGTWKGHLTTNQHTDFPDPFVRPLFGGQEVTSGFTGTFGDDQAEVFGTTLSGTRSMTFRATLKLLIETGSGPETNVSAKRITQFS
jgi:hypothetical protein